jgi:hypothetical protein
VIVNWRQIETLISFVFLAAKRPSRRAAWEEFCKRKAFKPSLCTRIYSLHFAEKSYEPSHYSPQFLESIGYTEKTSLRVKPNVYQRLTSLWQALAFLTYLHRHNRRELGDKPRRDNVKRYQYLKDTFTNSFNKFCFFNVLIFLHCFTI